MRFFERFRNALSRYADGVHGLGAPAGERAIADAERALARRLPDAFRDFLLEWNGGFLFGDDYALFRTDALRAKGAEVAIGEGPSGALWLDERGRVVAIDRDTDARTIEGSDFERWLDAILAREGLVYDREGEFRDGALEGVELAANVRQKRAEAAAKADPESPAWQEELGSILLAAGHAARAAKAVERATALDPDGATAWFALGKLRRAAGDSASASDAFARAATSEREPEEAAFAWANAARAAAEAVRKEAAAAYAAKSRAAQPSFTDEQRAAADHLAAEGDVEAAIERLELAHAVALDDEQIAQALARMRARRSLRPI